MTGKQPMEEEMVFQDTAGQFSEELYPAEAAPEMFGMEENPLLFREGKDVFLEQGAGADTHLCIKCAHPSKKIVNKALRNPWNPGTWFGGCRRIGIGLCKKHAENYAVAKALTFSLLGLGLIFIGFGIATFNIGMIIAGLVSCSVCGIFRAAVPVSSPNGKDEYAIVRGVGDAFKQSLPEFQAPVQPEVGE